MNNIHVKRFFNFFLLWCAVMMMVAWYGDYISEPELGKIEKIQRLDDGERCINTVQCAQAEVTIYYYRPKKYENGPIIHVEAVDLKGNVLHFPVEAYRRILPESLFYPSNTTRP